MILYFADRKMNIIGQASTNLPNGLIITSDKKTQDVETGVDIFECKVAFDDETRLAVENCAEVGNYLLRSNGGENEFYTIIETETDTKKQTVYIYAEDAGMDLLNEVVGAYEADQAYPISYYIDKYAAGSGFEIGINEASSLTRKLSWEGEATAAERIASVATQFDGCEVSYSFEIKGLFVTRKFINIYKQRGKDIGVTLRLNRDVSKIVTTKSIANLATALQCTGGTPEDSETPITLKNLTYDDGDFYVDGEILKSRKALEQWSRFIVRNGETQTEGGHIVRQFSYDTTSPAALCSYARTELKKAREMEVNYEVDISVLPDNAKIGDRINIVDEKGELYLSTRILQLESSVVDQEYTATLGEYLIKGNGISQKVADLAEQFAKNSQSAVRALTIAQTANTNANEAKTQADTAAANATAAQTTANDAATAASTAQATAEAAQTAANNAQSAVDSVEESVAGLETTVANAQAAAEQAQQAAATADTKATEAKTAATNAQTAADNAATAASTAQTTADTAKTNAENAQTAAEQAKSDAVAASTTAAAAKADAEQAQKDIDALGDDLTTLSNTMSADYARKTDLTEATASLQTQITQNAGMIATHAEQITTIDETANNAAEQAAAAQTTASAAQTAADAAKTDAAAAQTAADNASAAAATAQSEADAAKTAAATAQSVADKAKTDLEAAQADLATVQGRVDATEEDIAAAQAAVTAAQEAADKANTDATAAAKKAADAQSTADTAVTNAANAQTAADEAASKAALAQAAADEAKGDASAAVTKANEAAATATAAQNAANTAKTNAENAQTTADNAATAAAAAQKAADDADAKAAQAAADLATAQQNLADVTSRVDATEEDIAAAEAAVATAQAAADTAKANAAAAQSTADTAKANAATAQTAADNAKAAADAAQADADAAQAAADAAQADVDALAIRVTKTETDIVQTNEQIALLATKEEVTQTLGGYYTKEETDSALSVKAGEISSTVDSKIQNLKIGGRNLLKWTQNLRITETSGSDDGISKYMSNVGTLTKTDDGIKLTFDSSANAALSIPLVYDGCIENGEEITLSFDYRGNITSPGKFYFMQRTTPNVSNDLSALSTLVANETEWQHFSVTFANNNANVRTCYRVLLFYGNQSHTPDNWVEIKAGSLKLESGNKETDWTPAPEDVDASIDSVNTEIRQEITEQSTSITQNCQGIIMEALTAYTETGDFEAFRETVSSQLELLSNQMTLQFTQQQEQLSEMNDSLQNQLNTITKYFVFDINGLTIGQVDNPYKVIIDNDRYSMTVNGEDVMWIENGKVFAPQIQVTNGLQLFDYLVSQDSAGNVNCEYIGK